jgi:NAD-dependent dihydropyrimidine dehydrogenase PreA subunit
MKYLKNTVTLKYWPDRCTGCGRCSEVCPHGVFERADKKAVITDADRCMECGACSLNCDVNAISVQRGVGCATAVINSMIKGGEPTCGCSVPAETNIKCC